MTSLSDSIAVLAATAPPGLSKKQALAEVNSKITTLRTQLGKSPRLMPILDSARAIAELAELEGQLAAGGRVPTPAALAPVAAATTPVARPFESSGDGLTDSVVKASGVHNLRTFKAKSRRDRLFAAAANLPPGSLARACAESNLAKAQTELNDCN